MHNISIGVDLHKQQLTVCFLCGNWNETKKYIISNSGIDLFKKDILRFKEKGCNVRVAVESTGNTRYFYNQVEKTGVEILIVNTLKFKVVNESVNKTDKRDAKTIAEFLSKDILPTVKLTSERSETMRRLISIRKELVRTRVRLKNMIHGILLSIGIETKAGQLNSKKGLAKIMDLVINDNSRMLIKNILNNITDLNQRIKEIEEEMEQYVSNDKAVKILKSIPGTGSINATTVAGYIDDVNRFSHYNKFSAYCGLVPWVQCSDKTEHYGKITKRGPIELRTAIIQMVIGMIRCKEAKDNRLMSGYRSLKKIKGSGKALVATARKLTKIIWTMLKNDEEYKKEKMNDIHDQIRSNEISEKSRA